MSSSPRSSPSGGSCSRLALGFVVATIPFAFWLGSLMARSLHELARQTDEIQRFQIADRPRMHSIVAEIDELGRSVFTMRTVVRNFSSFIPRQIVQQLIESGASLELGGSRREVTVLFTDVADFTAKTEKADPSQVMIYTSRYFAALSEVIMRHHGTVDKFIGDAVMALWNAPADDPDHVANACKAVLACARRNAELNKSFRREGWPAYTTRFGLHVGDAVVGNIGSSDRMNYTALGATINLAARLEGLNKNYGTADPCERRRQGARRDPDSPFAASTRSAQGICRGGGDLRIMRRARRRWQRRTGFLRALGRRLCVDSAQRKPGARCSGFPIFSASIPGTASRNITPSGFVRRSSSAICWKRPGIERGGKRPPGSLTMDRTMDRRQLLTGAIGFAAGAATISAPAIVQARTRLRLGHLHVVAVDGQILTGLDRGSFERHGIDFELHGIQYRARSLRGDGRRPARCAVGGRRDLQLSGAWRAAARS